MDLHRIVTFWQYFVAVRHHAAKHYIEFRFYIRILIYYTRDIMMRYSISLIAASSHGAWIQQEISFLLI